MTPRALYLPRGTDASLALVHPPARDRLSPTGVLICPPFGWAEVASYRPRHDLAAALAAAGFATMRLDLPGIGDSAGGAREPDRLGAWVRAVADGAAWLRTDGGHRRVAVIGLGLGGAIALMAARSAPIDDIVLWDAPSSGRTVIRELRALHRMEAAEFPVPDEADGPGLPEGYLESGGFVMSDETVEAVAAFDVGGLELRGLRRALLLGRDGRDACSDLSGALRAAGVEVAGADGGEWAAMTPGDATQAKAPTAVLRTLVPWLGAGASTPSARPAPAAPRTTAELVAAHGRWRERPLQAERPWGRAFGILTEPAERTDDLLAVMFNAGVVRRTGPNRLWVETARRWAAQGVSSLRLDLAGIGDAGGDAAPYEDVERMYTPGLVEEAVAVLADLRARGFGRRFLLVGLCSGAYLAFHASRTAPDVAGAIMLNPRQLYFDPLIEVRRDARTARQWVTGAPTPRRMGKALRNPALLAVGARSAVATALGARAHRRASRLSVERIEAGLDDLHRLGRRATFVFSEGEPLLQEMREEGAIERVEGLSNVDLRIVRGPGHTFRPTWSQAVVHAHLDRALADVARA